MHACSLEVTCHCNKPCASVQCMSVLQCSKHPTQQPTSCRLHNYGTACCIGSPARTTVAGGTRQQGGVNNCTHSLTSHSRLIEHSPASLMKHCTARSCKCSSAAEAQVRSAACFRSKHRLLPDTRVHGRTVQIAAGQLDPHFNLLRCSV